MQHSTGPEIKDIVVTPIAIEDPPLLNAAGVHAPFALRIILQIITDDGITGISEIPGSLKIEKELQRAVPVLLGQDVFRLNQMEDLLARHFGQQDDDRGSAPWDQRVLVHIYSAIEVACLDIIGKVLERPVVDLLGGRRRDGVPFGAYLFYKLSGAGGTLGRQLKKDQLGWLAARQEQATTASEIVDQARSMIEHFGFRSIKLKGGAYPPDEEVEAILALSATFGPEVPLRLDPNALWSLDTALKVAGRLYGHLEYLEDPVRGQQAMSQLRSKIRLPLATNMCTTSLADLPESIRLGSEDIILSDHHFWGGLRASMNLANLCVAIGRGFSMHSNSHLGISLAAMVHLGAAVPDLQYDLDTHYPWQIDEVIEGGKLTFEEGQVQVPSGPGLGVKIDRVQLERLHQNYLDCGLTERNDEIEMQKVVPGWTFKPTRW